MEQSSQDEKIIHRQRKKWECIFWESPHSRSVLSRDTSSTYINIYKTVRFYLRRIHKNNLPNRQVEKILGMCGRGPSGSKRRHILPWTSSRSESTHRSSMKAVVGSWTRKGPLSFQAAGTTLLRLGPFWYHEWNCGLYWQVITISFYYCAMV